MNSKQPERFDEFGNVQGEFLYLDVYKAPFWNEKGEMIGTVGCGRIVTREKWIEEQRKQAEKALRESNRRLEQTLAELRAAQEKMVEQERLAAVGQLAAGIAHEYNNLMASIILYADLIRRGNDLTPKQQEHLAVIQKQSLRAANLTQQLVDFARRSLLHKEALNLVDFLESLHLVLNDMLPKNIQLQLSLPTCEMSVHADPERLQQAMINLVANAREAMPDGGDLHIKLSYTRVTEGEDVPWPASPGDKWAQITVSDTGAGIPADVLPHVFEPFFTTRAPLGSGLGLSQVYGIVKQHEGHVSMKSEEGQGTCVTIYLPVKA